MNQNMSDSGFYKFGLLLCLLSFAQILNAQSVKRQAISSYGSSSTSLGNTTISQTAGQSFNTANTSNGVLQGYQQTARFEVEEIKNTTEKVLAIAVFPNPASYAITLSSNEVLPQANIMVSDLAGKKIFADKIINHKEHKISCANWPNGIYLITVQDETNASKTLKLIISK